MAESSFKVQKLEHRLKEIESELASLLEELCEVKRLERLADGHLELDKRNYPETAQDRIKLFGQMFAARRDVYPQFWQNEHTGKKGYSPVC